MKIKEDINWWYDWEKSFLDIFKINEDEYKALYKSEKLSIKDFAWYTYNYILEKIAKAYQDGSTTEANFFKKNGIVYGQMTSFQVTFENKKGTHTWKQSHLSYIKYCQLKFEDLRGFEVFCVSCCKPCDAYYQRKLTIKEAIDHVNTIEERCSATYGGHRTTYFPIVPEYPDSPIKLEASVEK